MRLYFPVDLTGNLITIEKLVLGEIWTEDLPIFNPNALTSAPSWQAMYSDLSAQGPRHKKFKLLFNWIDLLGLLNCLSDLLVSIVNLVKRTWSQWSGRHLGM